MQGRVIKSTGQHYWIQQDSKIIKAVLRGQMRLEGRKTTNPLAVGDWVEFNLNSDNDAQIQTLLPRTNYLIRKSVNLSKQVHILASNIDLAVIVASWKMPKTSSGFIDRFLITAEAFQIPVLIVFNKVDLLSTDETESLHTFIQAYSLLGYHTIAVSAKDEAGVKKILEPLLKNKVVAFTGHSGAGKSTLLNCLCPELELKTNSISNQHEKGKHTTTFAEMHQWQNSSFIIDTPGIQEWGLIEIQGKDLHFYFPEFKHFRTACRFAQCTHSHEPQCAVRRAFDNDEERLWRYEAYLNMLQSDEFNWNRWER
jgi:ribosome biogenesis GTPase